MERRPWGSLVVEDEVAVVGLGVGLEFEAVVLLFFLGVAHGFEKRLGELGGVDDVVVVLSHIDGGAELATEGEGLGITQAGEVDCAVALFGEMVAEPVTECNDTEVVAIGIEKEGDVDLVIDLDIDFIGIDGFGFEDQFFVGFADDGSFFLGFLESCGLGFLEGYAFKAFAFCFFGGFLLLSFALCLFLFLFGGYGSQLLLMALVVDGRTFGTRVGYEFEASIAIGLDFGDIVLNLFGIMRHVSQFHFVLLVDFCSILKHRIGTNLMRRMSLSPRFNIVLKETMPFFLLFVELGKAVLAFDVGIGAFLVERVDILIRDGVVIEDKFEGECFFFHWRCGRERRV